MFTARSVSIYDDLVLQYVEHGDPAGVPMVLLHGVTDSWRSYEPVLPLLPASVRAFALTQRGHGDASRPASYRTSEFATDVEAFLDAVGIERAILVGHSMGAWNAARFAAEHPQRMRGLVLAGAFASFGDKPDLVDFWMNGITPLTDPVNPALVRQFQKDTLAQPVPDAFFEMVVAESLKLPARVWRGAFDGFMEDDSSGRLREIAAPTLLIYGAHDAFVPRADQDVLLASIAGSRLIVYENAGHALHWEEPERFAADVAAFAKQCA